ncbi:MAG TPA: TlyA family rRNA (cytidine-2'-O)-methyltransferase [Syntrophobacteraceae bacterium]|nr:TlyA family rRNA (cytidine-2'-O)-methyltransferase [Syntrophobacteraceae bacterium]
MAKPSTRLDRLLVERGLTPSRQRAEAMILAAHVRVNGQVVTKAGHRVNMDAEVAVHGSEHPFVSRGGVKLAHALATFQVAVEGLVAMDVGASTGGFTDCLLQQGARKIYAVDVGYGQLAWSLRQDPRVVVLERQNIRYLQREQIPDEIQLATVDVSFISLKLVIPVILPFLTPHGQLLALIKPQFEAGREHIGKKGVVRSPLIHAQVCRDIQEFCEKHSLRINGMVPSPILGPEGNQEFLLAAQL